jgi:hypothetical protein
MFESAARRPVDDPVVRPLRRTGQRICSRPGCSLPASATLTFAYEPRSARIVSLTDQAEPEAYDLCGDHADRTKPPYGWSLADERPDEPLLPGERPRDLGSDRTVAVLAAALRGDPGTEEDLLASPDEDLPESDAASATDDDFDDAVLAALTDLATPEASADRPSPAAPGWQVPAARD